MCQRLDFHTVKPLGEDKVLICRAIKGHGSGTCAEGDSVTEASSSLRPGHWRVICLFCYLLPVMMDQPPGTQKHQEQMTTDCNLKTMTQNNFLKLFLSSILSEL